MHFSKSVNIGKGLYLTEVEGLVQAAAPARAADHRQRGVRLPGDAALLGGSRQSCDRRHSGVRCSDNSCTFKIHIVVCKAGHILAMANGLQTVHNYVFVFYFYMIFNVMSFIILELLKLKAKLLVLK